MLIASPSTSARSKKGTGEALPVCPACGRLQCLCRPRFFAGQLLTEEDLNRLDRYIREKNKLHNRYVHGWGVVCGLEVYCDDCNSKFVRVKPGYALSPCGEDVVVCDEYTVDMCELIRQCREPDPQECDPFRQQRRPDCDEDTQEWILAICYQEKPMRGITALRNTGVRSCGCSGDGACGCNGKSATRRTAPKTSSSLPRTAAQCEETVICEGYCFTAYRAPLPELGSSEATFRGALGERLNACLEPYAKLLEDLQALRDDRLTNDVRLQRFRAIKQRLRDVISAQGLKDCTLLKRLSEVNCPSPTPRDDNFIGRGPFDNGLRECLIELALIWVEGVLECLCAALLPPCPPPVENDCIPLASVTVRKDDCRVLQVCNWTVHRKFATTWPSLQYWLSPLPIVSTLREFLENLCCGLDLFERDPRPGRVTVNSSFGAEGAGTRVALIDGEEFVRSATLSPTGEFVFEDVPAGNYFFVASLDGFQQYITGVTLADGEEKTVIARVLPLTPRTGEGVFVNGSILNAETRAPLPGVNVVIEGFKGTNIGAATNISGDFEFRNVPDDIYTIRAAFVGFQDFTATTALNVGDQLFLDIALMENEAAFASGGSGAAFRGRFVGADAQPPFSLKNLNLAQLAADAFTDRATMLDPKGLFLQAGGFQLEQAPSTLKSVERANFSQFMLLNQVVQPFVQGLASVAGPSVRQDSDATAAAPRTEAAATDTAEAFRRAKRTRRKTTRAPQTEEAAEAAEAEAVAESAETMTLQQELDALKSALAQLEARLANENDQG